MQWTFRYQHKRRRGFVDPRAPAGALIQRTRDGRTEFSVNHHITAAVKDNEGFFEFDVELK